MSIDGYDLASVSGSLSCTGWLSLDDQNTAGGDWRESATSDQFRLSELKPLCATVLAPGASFDLGSPFVTSGMRDLEFSFLLAGNTLPTTGVVAYEAFAAGLAGDYNGDGKVDAADYFVWRKTDGTPAGYAAWRSNFGSMASSGAEEGSTLASAAVPEPGTVLLLVPGAPFVSLSEDGRNTRV